MPELRSKAEALTPKLEQVIHTLEWVRIEEFVRSTWSGLFRWPKSRLYGFMNNSYRINISQDEGG
ncbi:MAG: hypothetical protein RIQ73_840 [Actinomycetota bacterium]